MEYFNNNPEVKLIIAPHEIHEEHIQNIISKLKRPYKRYSQCKDESEIETDCLIIDCIGLLSSIYRYGNMAYIGGGFGVGIHNILEAAVYGIPVVFGPNYSRFREAVQIIEEKGGFSIENYDEFKKIVDQFRNEPIFLNESGQKAGDFVKNNSGATDKILEKVFGK